MVREVQHLQYNTLSASNENEATITRRLPPGSTSLLPMRPTLAYFVALRLVLKTLLASSASKLAQSRLLRTSFDSLADVLAVPDESGREKAVYTLAEVFLV